MNFNKVFKFSVYDQNDGRRFIALSVILAHLTFMIFFIKALMLSITMKLDISARLTSQETTIIYHHMKNVLLKKKKRKEIQANMGD